MTSAHPYVNRTCDGCQRLLIGSSTQRRSGRWHCDECLAFFQEKAPAPQTEASTRAAYGSRKAAKEAEAMRRTTQGKLVTKWDGARWVRTVDTRIVIGQTPRTRFNQAAMALWPHFRAIP